MKKSVISVFAAAVLSVALSGSASASMSYGVNAGINLANVTGISSDQAESKIGFKIGGFAVQPLSETLKLQYGLNYSQTGTKIKTGNVESKMDSLQIPVVAKFAVAPNVGLNVGGYGSVLLSSKFGDEDTKSTNESLSFGLIFGASYGVAKNIEVGVDYQWGLTGLSKQTGDSQDRVLTFGVAYSL